MMPRRIDHALVLRLAAEGLSRTEIARRLGCSETHVSRICCRAGLRAGAPPSTVEVGRHYGRLLVEGDSGQRQGHNRLWRCLCDPERGGCGSRRNYRGSSLLSGRAESCGCLRRDRLIQRHRSRPRAPGESR